MNNILIITESRTVAKSIAQALDANVLHKGYFGKGTVAVTWTGGGIIASRPKSKFQFTVSSDMTADEVFAANFDFFVRKDGKGKGNRRASEKDEAQIGVIQRLWRNAATVVNAMKPSAPGEVIFTSLSNYIGIDRPVVRMWLTSITRKEILASLENGGNAPENYAGFHDDAIAEHTIGARPIEPDYAGMELSQGLWSMADLKTVALKLWGWAPAKTAGAAYALYNKGLISYPSDNKAMLPLSLASTFVGAFVNLRHHPVLGKKASSATVTGNETFWADNTGADDLHAVVITGLFPVDLSREEEMLYIVIADHILDIFNPEKAV